MNLHDENPVLNQQLGEAVALYWRLQEQGAEVDRKRFIAEHPDIAGALAEYFEMAGEVEQCAPHFNLAGGKPTVGSQFKIPATLKPGTDADASGLGGLPRTFGRYEIKDRLGNGNMGHVYLAFDTTLGRMVALKVPQLWPGAGRDVVERFKREARSLAKVSHENICQVFDFDDVDGVAYLTMEYVEGQDLSKWLRENQPLDPSRSAALVVVLARALQEAHDKGVIHRDLKPSNVMMTSKGGRPVPVIIDFGLARPAGDCRLTHVGERIGSPAYMSPEQVEPSRGVVSPLSDVWSLGVILYELLTGRLPFLGSADEVFCQVCQTPTIPPSRIRPGLSPQLEAVCMKAMAKSPTDRYQSMTELAEALERASPPPPPLGRWKKWAAILSAVMLLGLFVWHWLPGILAAKRPLPPLDLYTHGFVQRLRDKVWEEHNLRDGMVMYSGDQFRLTFSTNAACYVYVVAVDAEGKAQLLFPHQQIALEHQVRANEPYQIPDADNWFTLDDRTGSEVVYVLASHDRLTDLEALLEKGPEQRRLAGQLEGLVRKLEVPPKEMQTRGGRPIALRGVGVAPDRRHAKATLDSGKESQREMEVSLGTVHAVKRIRFDHKALP